MSSKYILAAAAVAVVAVEAQKSRPLSNMQAQVRPVRPEHPVRPVRPEHPVRRERPVRPEVRALDEQQADWAFNAGIQGGAGGRPQWNAGISAKWDEEQRFGGIPSSTGPYNPTPIYRPFDEEQADWAVNAGISGGAGGRPTYNAGVSVRWDEEQALGGFGGFGSSTGPYNPTPPFSPFDEQQADWQFNAGIQGQVGQPPSWNVGISAKWDEEQAYTTGAVNKDDFNINLNHKSGDKGDWRTALEKAYDLAKEAQKNGFFDEEQADWAVNAGISGGAGGRPQYNAGVSVRWDEEQALGGFGGFGSSTGPYNPTPPFSPFDEQQATGEFNAGISGGAGGRPTYNAGVTIRWEEEEEQRNLLKKINNALGKVDNVVSTVNHVAATTQSVGALFEEERELTKAEQTLQQIKVIARAALDKDLFTPEEKQRLAHKVNQLRAKMEHGAQMIEQAKTTIAQHKRF